MNTTAQDNIREATKVVTAHKQREGGGFIVRRPFPSLGLELVDPFLLLDEMGPVEYAPGEAVGAPDHPHRGFETVTYMLDGEFEHEDSAGHRGALRAGDVQWMTAGAGIVHSEMPSRRIREQGGRVHGFQIWVNLPARLKMTRPRYQEIAAARKIPTAQDRRRPGHGARDRGRGAGRSGRDRHAHADRLPGLVDPPRSGRDRAGGARPPGAGLRVRGRRPGRRHDGSGRATTASSPCSARATPSACAARTRRGRLLLLAGVPLREPVARYGPFVMNTEDEIVQAVRDFQSGRMGEITRTAQVD